MGSVVARQTRAKSSHDRDLQPEVRRGLAEAGGDAALSDERGGVLGRRVAAVRLLDRRPAAPGSRAGRGSRRSLSALRAGLRSCGRTPGSLRVEAVHHLAALGSAAPRCRLALMRRERVVHLERAVPARPPRFMLPTSTRAVEGSPPFVVLRSEVAQDQQLLEDVGVAMTPSRSGSSSTRRARARYCGGPHGQRVPADLVHARAGWSTAASTRRPSGASVFRRLRWRASFITHRGCSMRISVISSSTAGAGTLRRPSGTQGSDCS